MNFEGKYDRLMKRAKKRLLNSPLKCYTEKHHILPRCLFPQYSNFRKCPWNKAILTPEEHFDAHIFLVKMKRYRKHPKYCSLVCAMLLIIGKYKSIKVSRKFYGILKRKISIENKKLGIRPPSQKGKKQSKLHRIAISNALAGRKKSKKARLNMSLARKNKTWDEIYGLEKAKELRKKRKNQIPPTLGKKASKLTRRKQSISHKDQIPWNKGKCSLQVNTNKGKKLGPRNKKIKLKISKKLKGLKRPIKKCPHCKKSGGENLMKRWHFANCKNKKGK